MFVAFVVATVFATFVATPAYAQSATIDITGQPCLGGGMYQVDFRVNNTTDGTHVFNIQVVTDNGTLVHNKDYNVTNNQREWIKVTDNSDGGTIIVRHNGRVLSEKRFTRPNNCAGVTPDVTVDITGQPCLDNGMFQTDIRVNNRANTIQGVNIRVVTDNGTEIYNKNEAIAANGNVRAWFKIQDNSDGGTIYITANGKTIAEKRFTRPNNCPGIPVDPNLTIDITGQPCQDGGMFQVDFRVNNLVNRAEAINLMVVNDLGETIYNENHTIDANGNLREWVKFQNNANGGYIKVSVDGEEIVRKDITRKDNCPGEPNLTIDITGQPCKGNGMFQVDFRVNNLVNRDEAINLMVVTDAGETIYNKNHTVDANGNIREWVKFLNGVEGGYIKVSVDGEEIVRKDIARKDNCPTITLDPPPAPRCENGSYLWSQTVDVNDLNANGIPNVGLRFVGGATTQFMLPNLPALLNTPVEVTVSDAVAWDGYLGRPATGDQPNEQFRLIFLDEGNVVWSSDWTQDGIDTGVASDHWRGALGSAILPAGADKVVLAHWSDGEYGGGNGANSVVPTGVCIDIRALNPDIDIEKKTNGKQADNGTGPYIPVGDTVNWTYEVKNTGESRLVNIAVTDNQGVAVTCPETALDPGESMVCTGSGPATAGQYENIGKVVGTVPGTDLTTDDEDRSAYFGEELSLDIEKKTNGAQADNGTGPYVPVGNNVEWTYEVTNNSNVKVTNVVVTDNQGVDVTCPATELDAGASMTCIASGTATAGQYENIGKVVGEGPSGATDDDEDRSAYFGEEPSIDIEKKTNGQQADTGTGPYIPVGNAVEWTYEVTNTGNVALTDIVVLDAPEGAVTCPANELAVGASMTCTLAGTATAGQYENSSRVEGTSPAGQRPSDEDTSHYFGEEPGLDIEKATNGQDADAAPGPYIASGAAVNWTYVVTNTGNVQMTNIAVTDNQGVAVTCPAAELAVGASMTCEGAGVATDGQYTNVGRVEGTSPAGQTPSDEDTSNYYGTNPSVDIEKATNGQDADEATGPAVNVGEAVTWTYVVTNTGNTPLGNVVVTDDVLGQVCVIESIAIGANATCEAGPAPADYGQYTNLGSVAAQPLQLDGNALPDAPVTDEDRSHYVGTANPSLDLEKATNGEDADEVTGPQINVGENVAWSYVVTNTGDVDLINVVVTDDILGNVCTIALLPEGATETCNIAAVPADYGQYVNIGSAVGTPADEEGNPIVDQVSGEQLGNVSDDDPSHYIGTAAPAVDIEKATNGEDADEATGPAVNVGEPVTWTYVVTNTGDVNLINLVVTDSDLGAVCTIDQLAEGANATCEMGPVPADYGQYENNSTVVGTPADEAFVAIVDQATGEALGNVSDEDPSHYIGTANPSLDLEKSTNGEDADAAPGPAVNVGLPVTWTYSVTNTGDVDLINVAVTDDKLGEVCVIALLAEGATETCEAGPIPADLGQYTNVGTAVGTPADEEGNPIVDQVTEEPLGNVSDQDTSNYIGTAAPAVDIEKATNGEDADEITGPAVNVGGDVTWTYVVTNTGDVNLINLVVTDSDLGEICTIDQLAEGASATCEAGPAPADYGQYENNSTVVGTPADEAFVAIVDQATGEALGNVSDEDLSHYIGTANPSINLEKSTNGEDADAAPGVSVPALEAVTWTYSVTNTGDVDLINVVVTDNVEGEVCTIALLAEGATETCEATGVAEVGQYTNIGSVVGTPADEAGAPIVDQVSGEPLGNVTDEDPSNYFGLANPSLTIEKATNGEDADTATGPIVPVGAAMTWTYVVENTGNVDLANVTVTDDILGEVCVIPLLAVGATQTCSAEGLATEGQYKNIGTATGTPVEADGTTPATTPDGTPVDPATGEDPSHYFGAAPAVDVEKATNGEDADTGIGPLVLIGDAVTWTYVVENTGNIALANVVVTDDVIGEICVIPALAVGATETCSAEGVAELGQYINIGSVTGNPVDGAGEDVEGLEDPTDADTSHYFGADPSINIEKSPENQDLIAGETATFTITVSNTGNVPLSNVSINDPQTATCEVLINTLEVGGDSTYECSLENVTESFTNVAEVSATDPAGNPVNDNDDADVTVLELASLGDKVFKDVNRDGIQDAGDLPVADIQVNLWSAAADGTPDAQLATATTDADGLYSFANLDPRVDYIVQFVVPAEMNMPFTAQDAGDDDAADSDASDAGLSPVIDLAPGENNDTIDAGIITLTASIGDRVWKDLNRDGVQDAGEPGVEGITVNLLDADGETVLTTTTDANGAYIFENVEAVDATYVVEFVVPADMNMPFTAQDAGEDDDADSDAGTDGKSDPITPAPGDEITNIDAGIITPTASIGDKVFKDLDRDGVQDAGEPGVAGVTVNLWTVDADGAPVEIIATATTGATGSYTFTDVEPNTTYVVEFVVPADMDMPFTAQDAGEDDDADSDAGTNGITAPITPAPGEDITNVDAGVLQQTATIGDKVFKDTNRDGIQDAGEPGVEGVTVNLWTVDADGAPVEIVATATTNASGAYSFEDVTAGVAYVIEFVMPEGMNMPFTAQDAGEDDDADSDAGTNGITDPFTPDFGEEIDNIDAGVITPTASIGDKVFKDLDRDGVQDAGEPGVAGVTVNLWTVDADGAPVEIIATATTGATGSYLFTDVEPDTTYVVEFVVPADMDMPFTAQDAGEDDDADSDAGTNGITAPVTPAPGDDITNVDAGVLNQTATIGDKVFKDADRDGIQDAGEPGVEGVTVNLLDADGDEVATTTTDADGAYSFTDVEAGVEYVIEFVVPADMDMPFTAQDAGEDDDADSDAGTDGKTDPFTPQPGDDIDNIDAGVITPTASIGDKVFKDLDRDGVQDADEPGVAGIEVNLWTVDADGDPAEIIATATTSATGAYTFTDVEPNTTYVVQFVVPADMDMPFTAQDAGEDDDADSDAGTDGITAPITPAPGEDITNVDAGLLDQTASLGDTVFEDIDQDGTQDAGEPGIAGVVVNLLDSAGDEVATTTTDANGNYSFTDLVAGDYTVEFEAPNGFTPSPQDAGDDDAADSDADETTGRAPVTLAAGDNNDTVDAGFFVTPSPTPTATAEPTATATPEPTATPTEEPTATPTVEPTATSTPEPTATPTAVPASVGDTVFEDTDADGIQDAGESGIANVQVDLFNGEGDFVATTNTDADGEYSFTDLVPGDYYVVFYRPDGFTSSPQDAGDDDAVDSDADAGSGQTATFTLAAGENNDTIDAGYYVPATEVPTLTPTNTAEPTATPEATATATEEPTAAPTATATEEPTAAPTATATEEATAAPTATATEEATAAPTATATEEATAAPTATATEEATAAPTATATTVATEEPTPTPTSDKQPLEKGSVAGTIFNDTDNDGVQEDGEPGLSGYTINLQDCAGNTVATTVSGTNGAYSFADLDTDDYLIQVVRNNATTEQFSPADQGTDDAIDSDVNATTGETGCFTIDPGEDITDVDAGIYVPPLGADLDPPTIGKAVMDLSNNDGETTALNVAVLGESLSYMLTITNPNDDPISNVSISDVIPTQLDYQTATVTEGTGNVSYDATTRELTVDAGTLAAGETMKVQINAVVRNDNAIGDTIVNTATVSSNAGNAASNQVETKIIPGEIPNTGASLLGLADIKIELGAMAAILSLIAGAVLFAKKRRESDPSMI